MITAIEGTLVGASTDSVEISVGGVTIKVNVPTNSIENLGDLGERVRLFTMLQFSSRDEALTLFGFSSEDSRLAFQALIGVNGVGPRLALTILSSLTVESLALAIASGDAVAFKGIPGVGTKIAGRIVLELRGKLDTDLSPLSETDMNADLVQALTALGYTLSETLTAVARLPAGNAMSLEEKVRFCIQKISLD